MNLPDLPLTSGQCLRAREVLGWSQERLAGEAGLITGTIGNFERGSHATLAHTVALIARALGSAGVEFLPGGAVRLRERQADAS